MVRTTEKKSKIAQTPLRDLPRLLDDSGWQKIGL